MKYYIVLFDDGCLEVYNRKPEKGHFRLGAQFYECEEDTTIVDISEWIGTMYRIERKIKLIGG